MLIRQATRALVDEFAGVFNAETIDRYISDSQYKIGDRARFANWMPVLVERFTRDRLKAPRSPRARRHRPPRGVVPLRPQRGTVADGGRLAPAPRR